MKKFALTFSLLLLSIISFADGGCYYHVNKVFIETPKGKKVRLHFSVDMSQTSPHCGQLSKCSSFQWYKREGSNFSLIPGATNSYYDTYEPGVYMLIACGEGSSGPVTILNGEVYKNKIPKLAKVITNFSVYPNPTKDGLITLRVPTVSTSTTSTTYKVQLFNMTGRQLMGLNNREFGANLKMDLSSFGSGIFIMRITCGEDITTLKILIN